MNEAEILVSGAFKDKMENLYEFPPFLVQHLVEVAQNYRDGILSGTNDAVAKFTGTPAFRCRLSSRDTAAPLPDTCAQGSGI